MGDSLAVVPLGTGRHAVQLATGGYHTCVILDNNAMKCRGKGTDGQLGSGATAHLGDGAGEMGDNLAALELGAGRHAIQVSSGSLHTCAVLDNGDLKCWGGGGYGQLGSGSTDDIGSVAGQMGDSLAVVDLGTDRYAVQVAASAISQGAVLRFIASAPRARCRTGLGWGRCPRHRGDNASLGSRAD